MKTAWPKLPGDHNASVMILRHFQTSKMIFMDVSVIRTDFQVATLYARLVPELVLRMPQKTAKQVSVIPEL